MSTNKSKCAEIKREVWSECAINIHEIDPSCIQRPVQSIMWPFSIEMDRSDETWVHLKSPIVSFVSNCLNRSVASVVDWRARRTGFKPDSLQLFFPFFLLVF